MKLARLFFLRRLKKLLLVIFSVIIFLVLVLFLLSLSKKPETITYGMSFNTGYAEELGLNWQETYDAILDDLGVRHLRLAAHWNLTEPEPEKYNFVELDYQIKRAEEVGAEVVLAVGNRLPRWPECHTPDWVKTLEVEEKKAKRLDYIKEVVERYKGSSAVKYWQVENEPFLEIFAFDFCGKLDKELLDEEISLVRKIDSSRPIIVTDSGNLGTWSEAYKRGDIFGTSVYVYFWNPELGQFKTLLPAWFYRVKTNVNSLIFGEKPVFLIELSAEPWLTAPVITVPLDVQFSRMDQEKFQYILKYAKNTHFSKQYLWGAEWWYWLKLKGHPEMWDSNKNLFLKDKLESERIRESKGI